LLFIVILPPLEILVCTRDRPDIALFIRHSLSLVPFNAAAASVGAVEMAQQHRMPAIL